MKNKKETQTQVQVSDAMNEVNGLESTPQKTRIRTDISLQALKGIIKYKTDAKIKETGITSASLCANSFHFEHTLNSMATMMGYKHSAICAERNPAIFLDALSRKPEFCQLYLGNFEDMASGTLCDETYGKLGIHYKFNTTKSWKQLIWADFCGLASPETRKAFVDSASANFPCMAYATFNLRTREGIIDNMQGYTADKDQATIITQGLKIELEKAMVAQGVRYGVKIIYSVKYAGGGTESVPMLTVGYACGVGNDLPTISEDRTKANSFNYNLSLDKHIKQANPSKDPKWLQARQIISRMHPSKPTYSPTLKVKPNSPVKALILTRAKWYLTQHPEVATNKLNKWVHHSISKKFSDVSIGSVGSIICTNLTKLGSWNR